MTKNREKKKKKTRPATLPEHRAEKAVDCAVNFVADGAAKALEQAAADDQKVGRHDQASVTRRVADPKLLLQEHAWKARTQKGYRPFERISQSNAVRHATGGWG
jgi:hypothetical protein